MIIQHLELNTQLLLEQKNFYTQVLGMQMTEETADSFTVLAGYTRLTFKQANDRSIYHFAFNIEENKLESAVHFLKERTPLLSEGQDEIFHFKDWNAHACYFYDAAGNIVEFIARHNLVSQSAGAFSIHDLIGISELGMPVEAVADTILYCSNELGFAPWRGNGTTFQPIGDEHGLFIVATIDRAWFPTQDQAEAAPFTVTIAGSNEQVSIIPGYPYKIITTISPA
ncbi:VOC family protein [Paenibacillus lupini]|uniref:VOC family protein n=1 Tax=Paenibacillus lupini TaxID=1450204 RepID=UPI00141DB438|nr:VOC family protein [Paenibacillus lupini]NIK23727.1 catechol-2,3-dioxygenase [Paenibacillus lupini]